ncbi:hypothetical protein CFC21_089976 [Triticum aestivum]|uniref:Anticodon-binding domain-containing protein n=2 Tax=Triticum aestivum TaxID=4565 RepID=A0A9R1IMW4_WHEAT|nr:hypothetical protein CFC21_089976 [Triticum aestivum]
MRDRRWPSTSRGGHGRSPPGGCWLEGDELQSQRIRADLKLPISVEDAGRSAEEFAIAESKGVPLVHVGQDTRLDYRVIDVRTLANQAIFRIQHHVENIALKYG